MSPHCFPKTRQQRASPPASTALWYKQEGLLPWALRFRGTSCHKHTKQLVYCRYTAPLSLSSGTASPSSSALWLISFSPQGSASLHFFLCVLEVKATWVYRRVDYATADVKNGHCCGVWGSIEQQNALGKRKRQISNLSNKFLHNKVLFPRSARCPPSLLSPRFCLVLQLLINQHGVRRTCTWGLIPATLRFVCTSV